MAAAVRAKDAEWSQPLFFQYENIGWGGNRIGNGADILRRCWNDACPSQKLHPAVMPAGRREVLNLIHQEVQPHAVCPIIPFPSTHPRTGDLLIEEYGDSFETISGSMTSTWHVDSRDLVYAHETQNGAAELVHIWMHGQAYRYDEFQQEAEQ